MRLYPVIFLMKTAISVPDEIARAARKYLDELAAQSLTSQIDQALEMAADDSSAAAVAAGRRLLAAGDDSW